MLPSRFFFLLRSLRTVVFHSGSCSAIRVSFLYLSLSCIDSPPNPDLCARSSVLPLHSLSPALRRAYITCRTLTHLGRGRTERQPLPLIRPITKRYATSLALIPIPRQPCFYCVRVLRVTSQQCRGLARDPVATTVSSYNVQALGDFTGCTAPTVAADRNRAKQAETSGSGDGFSSCLGRHIRIAESAA